MQNRTLGLFAVLLAGCSQPVEDWIEQLTSSKPAQACAPEHFTRCFVWSKDRCEQEAARYVRECAVRKTQDHDGSVNAWDKPALEEEIDACIARDLNTVGAFFVKQDDTACVEAIKAATPPERHKNMARSMRAGPDGWPAQK